VPVAVAVALVARTRGLCCFNRFQKLSKDDAERASAPKALSTVNEDGPLEDTASALHE